MKKLLSSALFVMTIVAVVGFTPSASSELLQPNCADQTGTFQISGMGCEAVMQWYDGGWCYCSVQVPASCCGIPNMGYCWQNPWECWISGEECCM